MQPASGDELLKVVPLASASAPTLGNKARRAIWGVCWALLYRPTPTILHSWRRTILRIFGARIGKGAHPYPSARIWAPWNLTMEENSCLGAEVDCYNVAPIRLEQNSTVSQKSYLCSASHDIRDPAFRLMTAPITIRRGAWVAAAAFIGPGVVVGERAVVAAMTALTKSVPDGVVVGGNPARVISLRA
jgi:putative colanic acid biosynthesis acetyltransferase WcaF